MSGGLDAYLHTLKNKEMRAIAMSVLASGAIPPREAIEWISKQPNVQSVLFGASSRRNITSTRDLANEYMGTNITPRSVEA
jgi:aryl-alcohol dehydrogenase-like predicted oxidoreductase